MAKENKKEELVKIVLEVNDDTFGVSGESVWALPIGDDLYEIRNTPWHTCAVSWGDIVRAISEAESQKPKFVELVKPGGHRTLHVFFYEGHRAEERDEVLGMLKKWDANYENADGRLYAVDVNPGGDFEGLCEYLDQLEDSDKLSYRTKAS